MIIRCPPSSVSLRFFHPKVDPGEISRRLGVLPGHQWRSGEQRRTPKGTVLPGTREASYWCGKLEAKADEELTALLRRWLTLLEPHGEWLREFRSSGGRAEFYLGLIGDKNAGEIVPSEILGQVAGLGIDLGIEIFPTRQS